MPVQLTILIFREKDICQTLHYIICVFEMINVTLLELNQMCTQLINSYYINEKYSFSNLTITYFNVCKNQSRKLGLIYAILMISPHIHGQTICQKSRSILFIFAIIKVTIPKPDHMYIHFNQQSSYSWEKKIFVKHHYLFFGYL